MIIKLLQSKVLAGTGTNIMVEPIALPYKGKTLIYAALTRLSDVDKGCIQRVQRALEMKRKETVIGAGVDSRSLELADGKWCCPVHGSRGVVEREFKLIISRSQTRNINGTGGNTTAGCDGQFAIR